MMKKILLFLVAICFFNISLGMNFAPSTSADTVQVNKNNVIFRFQMNKPCSEFIIIPGKTASNRSDKLTFGLIFSDDQMFYPILYSKLNSLDLDKAVISHESKGCVIKVTVPRKQN